MIVSAKALIPQSGVLRIINMIMLDTCCCVYKCQNICLFVKMKHINTVRGAQDDQYDNHAHLHAALRFVSKWSKYFIF